MEEHSDSPGSASLGKPEGSPSGMLLKTKISMVGKNPAVVMPFYLLQSELPGPSSLTGSMDLLSYYGLENVHSKFCSAKRLKKELSVFLSDLPGQVDAASPQEESSLLSLLEKPPVPKPINPLSTTALAGFRLHPGQIPEQYRIITDGAGDKRKHKKRRRKVGVDGKSGSRDDSSRKVDDDKERKKKKKKDKKKKKSSDSKASNGKIQTTSSSAQF